MDITCSDKFGREFVAPLKAPAYIPNGSSKKLGGKDLPQLALNEQFDWYLNRVAHWDYLDLINYLQGLELSTREDENWLELIDLLTLMIDRRYNTGQLRRSSLLSLIDQTLGTAFDSIRGAPTQEICCLIVGEEQPPPAIADQKVILDARYFTPQDETSVAREIQRQYEKGFKRFIISHTRGHRFIGNGLGANTQGVRIDVYGSPGDYLGSGQDGMEIHVHNNGQDQLAQIMKSGKLVVHGDVGQTFMYAAKGGEVYVLGNAAGRALINAVGKPRVVINGTCLDYLAESFMAGDPLRGGGFIVLNGLTYDEHNLVDLETPYPGGNLFSLASGGAIYLRDPHGTVDADQLNGGEFCDLSVEDWELIKPYLEENARSFNIPLERLLTVDGELWQPERVYRKIRPRSLRALQAEEAWVREEEG